VIRGILFDFGNVICSFDVDRFLSRLHGWSGLPVETLRAQVYGSDFPRRFERGEISSEEFRSRIERITRAAVPIEAFEQGFTDIFTPMTDNQALILGLSRRYRLGLLSNTNEIHFRRHIRRVPVFSLFESVTVSFQVGALKPEAAIYRDALRKLGLPPHECVFIDDIPEYAEGARALGIHGIRYTSHADLLRDLSGLGVERA